MKIISAVAALVLFFAFRVMAQTTNGLSDAEIQGRKLTHEILSIEPGERSVLTGLMKIKDGKGTNYQYHFQLMTLPKGVALAKEGVMNIYHFGNATNENGPLTISPNNHFGTISMVFISHVDSNNFSAIYSSGDLELTGGGAGENTLSQNTNSWSSIYKQSDFWLADVGLEFFCWSKQKVLKHEVHRSCGCTVLESTNPDPATNGYSRVVSWIDNDTLGIVEAYAYDAKGKLLKDFYPKDFKKVDGRWQVQTLVMENVQTGSRSRLEFDLKK